MNILFFFVVHGGTKYFSAWFGSIFPPTKLDARCLYRGILSIAVETDFCLLQGAPEHLTVFEI
jgi:hypothetical protein